MKPKLDMTLAQSYMGKHLLLALNYCDAEGNPLHRRQFHGIILRINEQEGIVVALAAGEGELKLAPDISNFKAAPEGEYRLRTTGEVVVNPDLISEWDLREEPGEVM